MSGDWIYYRNSSDNDYLYKVGTNGAGITKVIADPVAYEVQVVSDWVYYLSEGAGKVVKVRTDGTGQADVGLEADSVNVGVDWIYYANKADGYRLYGIRTDGTAKAKLCDMGVAQIGVAGGWVYFRGLNTNGLNLYRVRPNGTGLERVK